MKKIAVITPGVLPVPTVLGGAVETLIEYYLDYNEDYLDHEITVFSIFHRLINTPGRKRYKKTSLNYLDNDCLLHRVQRYIYRKWRHSYYYNYYLDYFLFDALRTLKKKKYDVIIIENRPAFVLPVAEATDAKIILHLHNDTFDKNTKDALEILDRCDTVITVSEYIKNRVDSIKQTDKVKVVYNGIDLNRFRMETETTDRASYGIEENDFVAVFTGRLDPIKGINELLEAFRRLKDYRDIRLLVIGAANYGSHEEDSFTLEMKKKVADLDRQVIFTGYVDYSRIPSLLNMCDLGIIPSICEDALTLSSLEDMAMGLPLIVTRSGGIPEAVDDKCALVLEKDARLSVKLAQAILHLYKHPEMRKDMSDAAQKRALLFSKEKYAESFWKVVSGGFKE